VWPGRDRLRVVGKTGKFKALGSKELKGRPKRYKIPREVERLISKYSHTYGTQSRAIQVAAEILYRNPAPVTIPIDLLTGPLIGKTYKLPPRAIDVIARLAKRYGTLGNTLAACAVVLMDTPDL